MRGHIKQRSKGSWTIWVEAGRDPKTGKRVQTTRTIRGTKKQAESELADLIRSVETGTDIDPKRIMLADYIGRWLKAAKARVGPRTHERYEQLLNLHVVPTLGQVRLAKLRPLHLEQLYASLLEDLAPQTVVHVHRVVFAALRQAVRWQVAARNVAEAVTPPRPERRLVPALEPADATRLLEAVAGTDLDLPVTIAIGTGMRRGEILGLRWQDIDLDAGRAHVIQQLQHLGGALVFVAPKTHRSARPVSLPAFVTAALRKHRAAQNERRLVVGSAWQEAEDLVLDRGDGGPRRPDSLSKAFAKVARGVGLDLGFHDLRHAHASLMLAAGVHLKVVSDRLGHSTIGITADLYSHVAPALEEEAAATLDSLLGSQGR